MNAEVLFPLTGTVTATPAYPGPQRIDSPVPSHRPVAGATVTLSSAGAAVATTTTDGTGRFIFTVPAGGYDITVTDTGYPGGAAEQVTMTGPTTVTLIVDSGMR
jgi:carboxypeptidase family protein